MADKKARRYIVMDGKVKRIGIDHEINLPAKARQTLSEMQVFLNENNKAYDIQVHYIFLDEQGLVNHQPYELEAVAIVERFISRQESKTNMISFL